MMTSARLTFPNKTGEQLVARLDLPVDAPPRAYALFAHCFSCSKDFTAVVHISRILCRHGIGVLRFDFTGLGESGGDFADTDFATEVADLLAAAHFLDETYDAPRLLIGHSLGGTAVLAAAPELPSVTAVVTIGSPADPVHLQHILAGVADEITRTGRASISIGGHDVTVGSRLLDDIRSRQPIDGSRHLRAALLVLHSPRDLIVAIDQATQIFQAARHPKSFVSLDSADHLLTDSRDADYVGEVIAAWVDRYL